MTLPKEAYSTAVIYLKFFKKLQQNYDEEYHLTLNEYKDIIYLFNKKLSNKLLQGKVFDLPYNLGQLRIKKKKLNINTAKPNIQEYMKSGIKSKHYNEHSDGFVGSLYWKKESCTVPGSYMFSLNFTDTNKKKLAQVMKIKGEHKRFFE